MNFSEFLEHIINDGIEAAKTSYGDSKNKSKLEGSLAGFEACRGKSPSELKELFEEARRKCPAYSGSDGDYWFARCFEAEVEWVCNVVSAALQNQGEPPLIVPTARGLIKAAEILGVTSAGPMN